MSLNAVKRCLLVNGWWIALILALLSIPIWYLSSPRPEWPALLAVLGGLLSGSLIVQKQNLDELKLVHDLFKDFNARYDKCNAELQRVASEGFSDSDDKRALVVDYFNLCAEEYWWFKTGHLPEDIWQSWCRGMLWYLDKADFRDLWIKESTNNSYYGLTLEIIRRGAKV